MIFPAITEKCQVVLVNTPNPSPLMYSTNVQDGDNYGKILFSKDYNFDLFDEKRNFAHTNKKHLYILSNETPVAGELVYNKKFDSIDECTVAWIGLHKTALKPIIATTDIKLSFNNPKINIIPDEIIKIMISEYNLTNKITDIEVEFNNLFIKKYILKKDTNMTNPFVTCEHANKLIALGFNDPCFGYYYADDNDENGDPSWLYKLPNFSAKHKDGYLCDAPTYQQVINWTQEKYQIRIDYSSIKNDMDLRIDEFLKKIDTNPALVEDKTNFTHDAINKSLINIRNQIVDVIDQNDETSSFVISVLTVAEKALVKELDSRKDKFKTYNIKTQNKISLDDYNHLIWMYGRLTQIHNENTNLDYILRFKEIINKLA